MGPLSGVKIIELAGIGPGPFCGMMLSDMGADVIRVDRKAADKAPTDVLVRNRRSIAVDLKRPEGVELVLRLCGQADALFEGFRPGVTERLGLGPEHCMGRNPKLVYGRMTGWGQNGPMAQAAGHDINYIALSGALHAIGRKGERPVPPLNLVGDFGGGGMYLAFGLVCAILEARQSGKGQVVDVSMVDGAASLMSMFFTFAANGAFRTERGSNMLDGGAHFYDTYECADGESIALGSIEPQFYAELIQKAGLDPDTFRPQMDQSQWPQLKDTLAGVIRSKTRAEWCEIMEGSDVCFAPVLSLEEAPQHPHNQARGTFIEVDGVTQPAPAPRFDRTVPEVRGAAPAPGAHGREILAELGIDDAEAESMIAEGIVGAA